jgi:hypothetical protein
VTVLPDPQRGDSDDDLTSIDPGGRAKHRLADRACFSLDPVAWDRCNDLLDRPAQREPWARQAVREEKRLRVAGYVVASAVRTTTLRQPDESRLAPGDRLTISASSPEGSASSLL